MPWVKMLCLTAIALVCSGCFLKGTQIRYVVDVKTPIDRKQAEMHKRQDKGQPKVGKIRSEVKLRKTD